MENSKGLGTTKMYEHECESDEDCEVYFLKPVNEYNIVDKIKEANKELFAADDANLNNSVTTTHIDEATTSMNLNKKVTFATNLEDYEPITSTAELPAEPAAIKNGTKNEKADESTSDGIQRKLEADLKFSIIDEEELDDDEEIGEILQNALQEVKSNNEETKEGSDINENIATGSNKNKEYTDAEVVEEICEEIIIMDMDNGTTNSIEGQLRNKIIKQATFDYDESDNKSLTNLLTSDFEDEEEEEAQEEHETEYNNNADADDDDDDDQLSIIVASYIPDNFDKDSLVSETNSSNTEKIIKTKKVPFTKRFSFRRKKTSAANIPTSATSCRHMPPPEVTDLKLNYKTCCEYRNAVQEKLPRYTGYLSEYGLTREQLAKREAKLQRKQRFVLEQALKANDQEMRKMQDNERAFTTWLKQKMRFPINKTRNMFDVNRLAGCGSASAVRNRGSSGKFK